MTEPFMGLATPDMTDFVFDLILARGNLDLLIRSRLTTPLLDYWPDRMVQDALILSLRRSLQNIHELAEQAEPTSLLSTAWFHVHATLPDLSGLTPCDFLMLTLTLRGILTQASA